MERRFFVYILASQPNGTLYIGVTSNLVQRIWQHKAKLAKGFTEKYNIDRLVYYEIYDNIAPAIQREKQMKKWNRAWKIRLIEETNPHWRDLYGDITG